MGTTLSKFLPPAVAHQTGQPIPPGMGDPFAALGPPQGTQTSGFGGPNTITAAPMQQNGMPNNILSALQQGMPQGAGMNLKNSPVNAIRR